MDTTKNGWGGARTPPIGGEEKGAAGRRNVWIPRHLLRSSTYDRGSQLVLFLVCVCVLCVLCVVSTERCAMFALHGYAMKLMGVLEFSLELVRCVSYSGSGTWETPRETGHPPGCPT